MTKRVSIAFLVLSMAWVGMGQQADYCSKTPDDHCFPEVTSIKIVAIGKLKCADNQHIEGDGKSEAGNHCVDDSPKPLKCGKWEHVVSVYSQLTDFKLRDECAPIMHSVTEKEWQHLHDAITVDEQTIRILIERVKALEAKGK